MKTRSGQVAASKELSFRVNNSGRLAETTTSLMKDFPGSKRIWVDLIDSTDFPYDRSTGVAWYERPDAEERIADILSKYNLPATYESHFRKFIREGYVVLDDFIVRKVCQRINSDLEALIAREHSSTQFKGQRIQHLFEHSAATRRLWAHPQIFKVLSAIFDDQAVPCQTLNFMHGSQQAVHQDVIHLTPFPQGFMCGVWVALEDIHPDAGPLIVYPGSHRLPRLYTHTAQIEKVREDSDWDAFSAGYAPKNEGADRAVRARAGLLHAQGGLGADLA